MSDKPNPETKTKFFVTEDVGGTIYVRERMPDGSLAPVYDLDSEGNPTIEHVYNPTLDDDWVNVYWYEHKDKPIRHQRRKAIPKQNLVNIRKDVPLVWRERSVDVPTEMHLPNGKTWKGAITVQLPNREGIRERVKQKFPTLPDSAVEAQVDRFIGMWIRKELKVAYKLKTEVPKARRLVLPDEIDMTEELDVSDID